jgi:hypothetical protein
VSIVDTCQWGVGRAVYREDALKILALSADTNKRAVSAAERPNITTNRTTEELSACHSMLANSLARG